MTAALPKILNGRGGDLPLEPLIPLIVKDVGGYAAPGRIVDRGNLDGIGALAEATGLDVRLIGQWVSGRGEYVSVDKADRYLTHTGRHLADVWPWLYTIEQARADVEATTHPEEHTRRLIADTKARRYARRKLARVAS